MVSRLRVLHNEKGILTVDFLFAFILVFGMTGILFALMFTFSVAEVFQYITFSTARTYHGAHANLAKQEEVAKRKYEQLTTNKVIRPIMQNEWFEITGPEIGDFNRDFPSNRPDADTFWGVRIDFLAKMLNIRLPFYGSTTNDPDGLRARIATYLSREPTARECHDLLFQRWQNILRLSSAYSSTPSTGNPYILITDNGC